MKNTFSLFFLLFVIFSVHAQNNWVAYSKAIDTKGLEGRQFLLEASVRAEMEDDSAAARLFARVDKPKGYGFVENMWLRPIRNREWKTYSIEGIIDTGAFQLAFGALCQYNGKFYFDDFNIRVEDGKGGWQTVFTEDFENGNSLTQGSQSSKVRYDYNEAFRAETITGNAPQGQRCLLIEGQGVPNFGVNNKVGKYAEVNGIRLYYEVYGEGQPLVVLQGEIGFATPNIPYFLEKKYKVIAVDSRGYGKSGDTDAELTFEQMASDVNELMNQLGIDSAYFWTHSIGAITALIIAKDHPEKVKKITAFAPNLVADTTGIQPLIFHWAEKEAKNAKTAKDRKQWTQISKQPNIPFSELEKIQAEVLVMSGDRDWVPLAHTLEIFKHLPKSQLCVFPGATHMADWEKKELFHQIVSDFFEKPFAMPNTVDWFKN